jgi:DNA mismatch endonuclease (patch repair protein)
MDRLTPQARSRLMARIASKNTGPEMAVRSMLHRMGYRFGLHRKDLPGSPDIVLSRFRVAIYVHGCFWHGHVCKIDKMPKSRKTYWSKKIEDNRTRDLRQRARLRRAGWRVWVVWECELKRPERLRARLLRLIGVVEASGLR